MLDGTLDGMLEMPMSALWRKFRGIPKQKRFPRRARFVPLYQLMLAQAGGEWETARSICDSLPIDRDVVASSYRQAEQWGPRSLQGRVKSRVCLVIGLSALDLHNTGMQSVRGRSLPIRSRRPAAARNYRRCPLVQNPSTLPLACLHPDEYH
jgi:hypothetical protein